MKTKRNRLVTQCTDSKELICYLVNGSGHAVSEKWFWVPETGQLRRWRMKTADALTAKTREEVESAIRINV